MAAKRRNSTRPRTSKKKQVGRKNTSSFRAVLKKVEKLTPSQRVQAMKIANNKFINELTRHVQKLQYAHVPPNMQRRLKRQARKLRKFTNRKTTVLTKRRMLTHQRGGFLPLLLAALPALGSIVGGVISRA